MQGLKIETLDAFGVRATSNGRGLVFPVYSFTGSLVGVKIFSVPDETETTKPNITIRTIPRLNSCVCGVFCCYALNTVVFGPLVINSAERT